ncbi:hypothetical protein GCM10010869_13370 [Mesorhizobium tianshanense]|nr:hypothetical protein GCM10010869_13370 [Mesorhizobium tianshanense]
MAQKEGEQLLAFTAQIVACSFPGPNQIADSLMDDVRHPHSSQLARSMQPRQRDRVPSVRLDPLARPLRDQGRRNHHAVVTKIANLPAQPVTGRPGLEADVQSIILLSQLLDRPLYRCRTIFDLADKPDLAGAAALRDRHRVLLLGYIKRDKRFAILSHGSPSVREDRLGPSEQPSSLNRTKGRATDLSPGT